MASENVVVLIGNIGKTPDYQTTPNGTEILKFSIATTENVKNGENWEKKTDWHNIVAFGKTAEFNSKYLDKGSLVSIVGRIANNNYEKDGVKHYGYNIIANKIKNLTPKPKDDDGLDEDNPL